MTWIATHDTNGRKCWLNDSTGERAYRNFGGSPPASPAVTPMLAPQAPIVSPMATPMAVQPSPPAYPYQGGYVAGVPPLNLGGGYALVAGPGGYAWVNPNNNYASYGSYTWSV
ncbi:unnamed protein product [Sphacelaria rigidula]